ncbi:NfeD family protein [Marinimicrobium agarilyticum]|uniref:NfeD family protein n=1 Tax=Marinimicrobium agarilyticum TaxID=306546 RepID=UPI0004077D0C|nr:nodulation protein NfeD [Marinimicrobium agarilyticum]
MPLPHGSNRNRSRWRPVRLTACLLLLLAGLTGLVQGQGASGQAPVYQVAIDGAINPSALGLLQHAIDTAELNGAAALVMRIDTPGGLLSTTRDMVSAIGESEVPVIGYVGPSGAGATSAGAFILLSTHVAVMNEGTTVGASSPVAGDGSDIEGTMAKKVMNDSRAFMRSIAESRGRNADLAERFVSDAESVTAAEALEANVIDRVVPEASELLATLDGIEIQFHGKPLTLSLAERPLVEIEPRLIDRLLAVIASPQIAHLLISLGMLAIYIEFLSPGLTFPGVLGTIAVILGLIGAQALPVNVGFLILLFLGLVLMFAELFVAGLGVLGIGGAIAFVLGSLNLFDMPSTDEYRNTVLAVSVGVSAAIMLATFLIGRGLAAARPREKSLVGKRGEAMVNFDKNGYVLVDDKRWPAEARTPLHHGDAIVVVAQTDDGRLVVEPVSGARVPS